MRGFFARSRAADSGTGQPHEVVLLRQDTQGISRNSKAKPPEVLHLLIWQETPAHANLGFNTLVVILRGKGSGSFFKIPWCLSRVKIPKWQKIFPLQPGTTWMFDLKNECAGFIFVVALFLFPTPPPFDSC